MALGRRAGAASPPGRRDGAGLVRGGLHTAVRRLQPRAPRRRQAGAHLPRREDRRRVRVPGRVPPRLLQRPHQAAGGPHRRRRRRLLHVERGRVREDARRAGLRVPGERARAGVAGADQRVRQRQHGGRTGGALQPLVRPHQGLPPVHHPMDQCEDHLLHRRDADQGGREDGVHGRAVPGQAHVTVRHHLGRLQLGHLGGPLQGGLQVRAVRRRVHRPRAPWLRRQPRRHHTGVPGGAGRDLVRAAVRDGGVPRAVHDVRLLLRPPPVPRAVARVHCRPGGRGVPPFRRRNGVVAQTRRQATTAARRRRLRLLIAAGVPCQLRHGDACMIRFLIS